MVEVGARTDRGIGMGGRVRNHIRASGSSSSGSIAHLVIAGSQHPAVSPTAFAARVSSRAAMCKPGKAQWARDLPGLLLQGRRLLKVVHPHSLCPGKAVSKV